MCATGQSSEPEALAGRYREIAPEPVQLFAVPAEERILDKLIWPLRHAKASFMLGNHVGTIALGGMVAEMVAMLLFRPVSNPNQWQADEREGPRSGLWS
jgi:hypothetical protein